MYFLSKYLPKYEVIMTGNAMYPETFAERRTPSLHHGFLLLSSIIVKGLKSLVRVLGLRVRLSRPTVAGTFLVLKKHRKVFRFLDANEAVHLLLPANKNTAFTSGF